MAVEVDEDDEEDDSVILDNGDFPACFGRGATIVFSVTEGTSAGLAPTLTGEEDTDCETNERPTERGNHSENCHHLSVLP